MSYFYPILLFHSWKSSKPLGVYMPKFEEKNVIYEVCFIYLSIIIIDLSMYLFTTQHKGQNFWNDDVKTSLNLFFNKSNKNTDELSIPLQNYGN